MVVYITSQLRAHETAHFSLFPFDLPTSAFCFFACIPSFLSFVIMFFPCLSQSTQTGKHFNPPLLHLSVTHLYSRWWREVFFLVGTLSTKIGQVVHSMMCMCQYRYYIRYGYIDVFKWLGISSPQIFSVIWSWGSISNQSCRSNVSTLTAWLQCNQWLIL